MGRMIIVTATLSFIISAASHAQNAPHTPHPTPLMPLYQCLKIDNSARRLSCLENQTQILKSQEQNREILAFDAQYARKIREEAFGFYLPSLPNIGVPTLSNANSNISQSQSFTVHSVRKIGRDYVFTMTNGQVWRQSGGDFRYIPNGNLTAHISHADMGNYNIRLVTDHEQVSGMLVRRIQ